MREGSSSFPSPPENKSPNEKGANFSLPITRKEFINYGITAVLGASALEAIHYYQKRHKRKEHHEQINGIEIPQFIYQTPEGEYRDLVPDNITEVIDDAWIALQKKEAGYEIHSIPLAPDKAGRDGRGKNKRSRSKQRLRPSLSTKTQVESNTLLATLDLSAKENKNIHFVKVNVKGMPEEASHQVRRGPDLGVGTRFDVTIPADHVVLAIKKALDLNGEVQEVIYTPYNPELDVPLLRKKGFEYLSNLLEEARKDLNKSGVHSLLGRNRPVAKDVPADVAMKLTIIEQVDPNYFKVRSNKLVKRYGISSKQADIQVMKSMANAALTVVGANREFARIYSHSDKGADGLFQLMPAPYKRLETKLQPGAKLNPDFREGASDHLNAAKASLLLLDSNYRDLNASHLVNDLKKNPELVGEYLSASYNAGSKVVLDAMRSSPKDWTIHLSQESTDYVRKWRALENLFNGNIEPLPDIIEPSKHKTLVERNRSKRREFKQVPHELRGPGTGSMDRQHDHARREGLVFIPNRQGDGKRKGLDELTQYKTPPEKRHNPYLVPIPENEFLKVDPSMPSWRRFCRPEAAKFLLDLAHASHKANPDFEPILVSSAVRPEDLQKQMLRGNRNASDNSLHPTGAVVDILYNSLNVGEETVYKGMSETQIKWTEGHLIDLEERGLIEATEEVKEPCFHVMTFEEYLKSKH